MPSAEVMFERAVAIMDTLPASGPILSKMDEDEELTFYKYHKQATAGDINVPRPGFLNSWLGIGEGVAEWDAWKSVEGTSKEAACEKYVEAFIKLLKKPARQEGKAYIAEIRRD